MVQAQIQPKLMTLEEFLDWYPEGYRRYELHNGVVVEMQPKGTHEEIISFLALELGIEIRSSSLPYFSATRCIIKSIDSDRSGFNPDITILDRNALQDESLWEKRSTITRGETVKLAIEVVSSNWQDDYVTKVLEYEKLGIVEYWIVDYLGLGGRRYIGNPKQPTISIYQMMEGEYDLKLFRGSDRLESSIFPDLNLTAEQIFAA
ncbi:MAG: Uma2 family endonuclease [Cyanobacteria bacterium P01_E01_bin.42]